MGAAAGVGGAVEVEGGVGGLRGGGLPVPAGDGVVAEGARPPQALQTPMEKWMLSRLVLTDQEGIRPGMPSLR